MAPQPDTEVLSFVERSPVLLRWGGGAFLAIIATALAAGAVAESNWGLYIAAALFAFVALWWLFWAKITVTVDEQTVTLAGPLWKRRVQRENVRDVSVTEDSGLNTGLVNWPVTAHERGSLTRLNMGGSAAVTFSESSGHCYQFVLANRQSAELMAEAISD